MALVISDDTTKMKFDFNEQETTKQFHLDVPRMDIYIDNVLCEKNSEQVSEQLKNKFKMNLINFIFFTLTQTFLADFYIKEFKEKIKTEESLLDNGNYTVKIYSENSIINIEKDFKVMYIEGDSYYLLNFCTLDITVYLDTMNIVHVWNYDNNNEIMIVELFKDF